MNAAPAGVLTPLGLARRVHPAYRWGGMHHAIQDALLGVAAGRTKRLMVLTPPQHAKSTVVSQVFPAWLLMSDPRQKLLHLSYEAGLAEINSEAARNIVAQHGPGLLGVGVRPGSRSKKRWVVDSARGSGSFTAGGMMGSVTGRAATGVIIDDPIKGDEQAASPAIRDKVWRTYASVAETRLSPDGWVIIVMTAWHPDDLRGRLLEAEADDWTVLSLPALAVGGDALGRAPGGALWPERYPLAWYAKRRRQYESRGLSYQWESLYQCNPTGDGGAREWPADYWGPHVWADPSQFPEPGQVRLQVLSLDPSKSKGSKSTDYSSFTHLTVTHDWHLYVRTWAQRVAAEPLVEMSVSLLRSTLPAAFLVESNMLQSLFSDMIRRACAAASPPVPCPIYEHHSSEDKVVRIRMGLGPILAQRRLHLLTDSPGNKILAQQGREFPSATHDDCLDSLDMAVQMANKLVTGRARPGGGGAGGLVLRA